MLAINCKVSAQLLKEIDDLVEREVYASRSELIRTALRDLIAKEKQK